MLKKFLFLLLTLSFLKADYFLVDEVLRVKEFNEKINKLATEVHQKTGWSIYMLAAEDIGAQKLVDFQKRYEESFKKPYIVFALALKQGSVEAGKLDNRTGKVGIYGSKGYREKIDREDVLGNVYDLLGTKVRTDPRNKYIQVLFNGYADIADELADSYGVDLENSPGNANRIVINILRLLFYGMIIGAFAIYFYQKYKRER
jgi:hypothetical protein